MTTVACIYGVGRNIASIGLGEIMVVLKSTKYSLIGTTMLTFASLTSKATVIFFLLRLVAERWHRIVLWFLLLANALIFILLVFFNFLRCQPAAKAWNPLMEGECRLDMRLFAVFASCK